MEFNIIEVTDEYYNNLSSVQRQLLRTAQKKKNELEHKAEQDIALYRRYLYTNGAQLSTLLEQKTKEIKDELDYELSILKEQLLYSIKLNEASVPDDNIGGNDVGYLVDYSLSYTDRYVIVRDYYLSIPDPSERIALYLADEVAKKYLDKYYNSLYNVLLTYSQ